MQCPHCGQTAEHPVIWTDPSDYRWSDEMGPIFERLVGRDIHYRYRTKQCKKCEKEFKSVEMADVYLRALVNEVSRLRAEEQRLTSELAALGKEVSRSSAEGVRLISELTQGLAQSKTALQQYRGAVDRAAKALSRVTKGQLTKHQTRPRRKRRTR
jgi:seryl-tRNA synthetase